MRKPRSSATTPAGPLKLSKHQAFTTETIPRSRIAGAPYNPRTIDEHAKKKLRANLKAVGLVQPLIWNKRTGNLVGGHQRLGLLDSLEGSADYLLTVAVVDMDPKTEREQNIFLNNASAMGSWDEDLLVEMLKGDDRIDITAAGFDLTDVEVLTDDPEILQFFAEQNNPDTPDLTAMADAGKLARKAAAEAKRAEASTVDAIKARRQEYKAEDRAKDSCEYYAVVVFESDDARVDFMARMGTDPAQRYVDGARVMSNLAERPEDLTPGGRSERREEQRQRDLQRRDADVAGDA